MTADNSEPVASPPAELLVEGVDKWFRTDRATTHAIENVSLRVAGGEFVCMVGPSGCGKSTLLGLIGGLDAPTEGQIWLDGVEISGLPEPERAERRRRDIGFVFQADNLLPFLTVVENVALQLSLGSEEDAYDRCVELLTRLGLAEQIDKLPDQLSGGQRQRVAVARALVHRPSLVLADEPTGALDADNSATVIDLLLAAQSEIGATLVAVTHDTGVARRLDRTVGLLDGRLTGEVVEAGAR
jgi:putative ABC transport system ATP-binding protein